MKILAYLTALCALVVAPAANATVIYHWDGGDSSFTYTSSDFVTSEQWIDAADLDGCSIARSTCAYALFEPARLGHDVLWLFDTNGIPDITVGGNYPVGTFSTPGTYTNLFGTLTITQTAPVPEPAAWVMMIAGLGLAGAAMRRRARAVAFAR